MKTHQQRGSQSAFEQEALPYLHEAHTFAYRMCGNRDHAADLVQEAFLRAYAAYSTFASGTNFRAWLFQIIKNLYINERRRSRFHGVLPSANPDDDRPSGDPFDQIPDTVGIDQHFDRSLSDEIAQAMENLPDMYRTILILADLEELQYEEVADVVHRPVGTVRSRLHRARKLLREELEPYARQYGYLAA